MLSKILSVLLILAFGTLFVGALISENKTGIISTGIVFIVVCISQSFELIPRLRKWNTRIRTRSGRG